VRDPSRIDEVLRLVEEIWRLSPDLRLGQLILNAQRMSKTGAADIDLWEVEDADLVRGLNNYRDLLKPGD